MAKPDVPAATRALVYERDKAPHTMSTAQVDIPATPPEAKK